MEYKYLNSLDIHSYLEYEGTVQNLERQLQGRIDFDEMAHLVLMIDKLNEDYQTGMINEVELF